MMQYDIIESNIIQYVFGPVARERSHNLTIQAVVGNVSSHGSRQGG